MFSFNQTIRSQMKTTQNLKSSSMSKIIPIPRREKIKEILVLNFLKKYELRENEINLDDEMDNFLKKESITDQDLKKFDNHLSNLVNERKSCSNLHRNLVLDTKISNSQELSYLNGLRKSVELPDLNDNKSVTSKHSKMSGISKLSLFSDIDDLKRTQKNQTYKQLKDSINEGKVDYSNNMPIDIKDDAEINKYIQKVFEQEKVEKKIIEKEIRKKIKQTLDEQIKEKAFRKCVEFERNRILDDIVLQHVDYMTNLEREKEMQIRLKRLVENDCRDKQLEDEIRRKKIEAFKTKKYERDFGII